MITFLLLSYPTTIPIITILRWPLMRIYMSVDVDLILVCFKKIKKPSKCQFQSFMLWGKWHSLEIDIRQPRVVRNLIKMER